MFDLITVLILFLVSSSSYLLGELGASKEIQEHAWNLAPHFIIMILCVRVFLLIPYEKSKYPKIKLLWAFTTFCSLLNPVVYLYSIDVNFIVYVFFLLAFIYVLYRGRWTL